MHGKAVRKKVCKGQLLHSWQKHINMYGVTMAPWFTMQVH